MGARSGRAVRAPPSRSGRRAYHAEPLESPETLETYNDHLRTSSANGVAQGRGRTAAGAANRERMGVAPRRFPQLFLTFLPCMVSQESASSRQGSSAGVPVGTDSQRRLVELLRPNECSTPLIIPDTVAGGLGRPEGSPHFRVPVPLAGRSAWLRPEAVSGDLVRHHDGLAGHQPPASKRWR
jgi:hypothetical protein